MSKRLPVVSGKKLALILLKCGWKLERQKGSHMIFIKEGENEPLVVPMHNPIKKGTLQGILKAAGIPREEFRQLVLR